MTCLFSRSIRFRSLEDGALITLACLSLALFTVLRASAQTSQFEQQGDRQLKREPAQPQKQPVKHRVALVIGNGAYQNANRLANPVNDAEDMAAALRGLNFELVGGGAHVNQTADQMKRLIDNFGELLGGGGVGLFFYAGHGVQAQGHNYLIPIEANILNEKTLEYDAVDVDRLLARMDAAGNAFNIVILDACRSNPFSRSWRDTSQGLAQVNAPEGTLIAYSTSPGHVANDGKGRNGSYTAELLQQMVRPGLKIEEMFKSVRIRVRAASKNEQTPWESSSLVGDFCFAGSCAGGSASLPGATRPSSAGDQAAFELSYWESIKSSSDPHDFEAYLQKYPNGQFADLAKNNLSRLKVRSNNNGNQQFPGSTRDAKAGKILLNVTLKQEGGSAAYDADLTATFLEVLSGVNLDVTDISLVDTKTRTRLFSNIGALRGGYAVISPFELVIEADLVLNERVASGTDGMFIATVSGLIRVFDCSIGRAVITKNLSLRGFGLNPGQAISNAKRNVREGLTEEVLAKIVDYAGPAGQPAQKQSQKVHTESFTFELVECASSGSTATCELVITNYDIERQLKFMGNTLFDDLGSAHNSRENQIGNSGRLAVMVSGVATRARVTFSDIPMQVRSSPLLTFNFNVDRADARFGGGGYSFKVEFRNVVLKK